MAKWPTFIVPVVFLASSGCADVNKVIDVGRGILDTVERAVSDYPPVPEDPKP